MHTGWIFRLRWAIFKGVLCTLTDRPNFDESLTIKTNYAAWMAEQLNEHLSITSKPPGIMFCLRRTVQRLMVSAYGFPSRFSYQLLLTFFMQTSRLLQRLINERLRALHPEKVEDAAIRLWEELATQISSIIGAGGFNALYTRSVFFTQATFPWLAASELSTHADSPFAALKYSFEAQAPVEVAAANGLLLTTFSDILASLIGEELTANILSVAWGAEVSDTSKEFKNE